MPGYDVAGDARRVFDCVRSGGVAVIHLDVAYAVLGRTEAAVRRIYAAKSRSFDKPTGIVGNLAAHEAVHVLPEAARRMVRAITVEHDLPLAVIAPYRADHPYLAGLSPFVRSNAVKGETLNLLLNAGTLREAIAALCWAEQVPFVGSSANASLRGSKFRLADVDPEVLAIADFAIDYGDSAYRNDAGRSSTMIDFGSMRVVRRGVCYDEIAGVLRAQFGVDLDRESAR